MKPATGEYPLAHGLLMRRVEAATGQEALAAAGLGPAPGPGLPLGAESNLALAPAKPLGDLLAPQALVPESKASPHARPLQPIDCLLPCPPALVWRMGYPGQVLHLRVHSVNLSSFVDCSCTAYGIGLS